MELTPEQLRRAVAAAKAGRELPDGPIIEVFNPLALAEAIEGECARTSSLAGQKITLHMDPIDALLLAKHLRYGTTG